MFWPKDLVFTLLQMVMPGQTTQQMMPKFVAQPSQITSSRLAQNSSYNGSAKGIPWYYHRDQ